MLILQYYGSYSLARVSPLKTEISSHSHLHRWGAFSRPTAAVRALWAREDHLENTVKIIPAIDQGQ